MIRYHFVSNGVYLKGAKKTAPVKKTVNKESSLSPELQHFVRKIYSEATGNLTKNLDCKITKKGIQTPLGVLSKQQIERGDEVLDQILQEIKGKNRKDVLTQLSSEYYTNIPHSHGRSREAIASSIIKSESQYHEKMELSQLMKDMLLVTEEENVLFEDDVDAKYEALGTKMRPVTKVSVLS